MRDCGEPRPLFHGQGGRPSISVQRTRGHPRLSRQLYTISRLERCESPSGKEKEKEAAKTQEDKTAKVRLNEKRRMSFKEKREFEQLEQEIADLETEKNAIEEALCSGTLSVDELTEKSKRLPELSDLIDEKTLRWLELSEIESN